MSDPQKKKVSWAAGALAVLAMMIGIGSLALANTTSQQTVAAPAPAITLVSEVSDAVEMARDYLEISGFSKSGLISQLEYEGFSTSDATAAVHQLEANGEVNWYEQAARSARSYREISPFSRKGLIEQLEYEGFTYQQAVYGADHS
ncbi:Ltp family lipoprotein [Gordonia aurantiaca]|uniref:Ltp family lipoprotein n=1 Tax=Gordonia sp. B21 TaxID=3151852 RepID=UPI0032671D65